MLLYSLCVIALVLPLGVMSQDSSSPGGSGSGSGSGSGTIFPLTTLSSLTQQQRDNLVTVGFIGMTTDNFMEVGTTFQEATANAINDYYNNQRIAKRQAMISEKDIFVVDVMEIDGVLMVVFVVGDKDIINSAEMVNILNIEGARIAQALQDALNAAGLSVTVEFAGVMGVASAPDSSSPVQFTQTTIIGIAVAGILSVVFLAMVVVAVAVYTFRKRKSRAKEESASADYVEVPAEGTNSFSSKWQPMKVNDQGHYEAVPTSFNKENSDANTHTAL